MAVSIWIVAEYVTTVDEQGAERQQWIYRRTFYSESDLAYHLDSEAPYLYNPNPLLRISRVDLPAADEQEHRIQTPGAEPIEQAGEQGEQAPSGAEPSPDPNSRESQFPQVDNSPTSTDQGEPTDEQAPTEPESEQESAP